MLVGNKADLPRNVSRAEAAALARRHRMLYIEVSAKSGYNVSCLMENVILEAVKKIEKVIG